MDEECSDQEKPNFEAEMIAVKIGRCHKALAARKITPWNFLCTLPRAGWHLFLISRLFHRIDCLLPGPIEIQAQNLSPGSLYVLAEASSVLPTRHKCKSAYLKHASLRYAQELERRERQKGLSQKNGTEN
jgi:hypothetical protein